MFVVVIVCFVLGLGSIGFWCDKENTLLIDDDDGHLNIDKILSLSVIMRVQIKHVFTKINQISKKNWLML